MSPEIVKRATIEDVARQAGVSRAAVSKVIRGAYGVSASMRERVEAVIEELDYRPLVSARGMRGATFTLGMEFSDLSNQFFARILSGATTALETEPYQLMIAPADAEHRAGLYRALEALLDRQVDGLIAVSTQVDPQWLEELARRIPVVVLGRHDQSVGYDTVVGDDTAGARMLMQHLLDLGHREIVHLTLAEEITDPGSGTGHAFRLAAYQAVMREAGIEDSIRVVRCSASEDSAREATLRMLARKTRPTAIFAAHDTLALGVLGALSQRGLASEISVAGYDNSKLAGHPMIGLTSVEQPGERMGRLLVSLLLERLAGRTEAVHEVVTPRVIPRSSTRPLDQHVVVTRS